MKNQNQPGINSPIRFLSAKFSSNKSPKLSFKYPHVPLTHPNQQKKKRKNKQEK